MQTINLQIEQDLFSQVVQQLKELLAQYKNSNFTYIDKLGDTIQVINGKEFVIPTKEDLQAIKKPYNTSDFTSLEDLKKELCIN